MCHTNLLFQLVKVIKKKGIDKEARKKSGSGRVKMDSKQQEHRFWNKGTLWKETVAIPNYEKVSGNKFVRKDT